MDEYTRADIDEAVRPIASLLSKSEKSRLKVPPGTWQHTMLGENIAALRIALSLMEPRAIEPIDRPDGALKDALRALRSMIERTEKSGAKFAPGTSQHSLQRNRLKALRIAEALVAQRSGGARA